MTPSIAFLMHELLQQQPEPPRQVKLIDVLYAILGGKSKKNTIIIFLVGLLLGLYILILIFIVSQAARSPDQLSVVLCMIPLFLLIFIPFIYVYRLTKAIRIGRKVLAIVESVEYSGPGVPNTTLSAIENGIAHGTWRLPDGQSLEFEVDEIWAKDLKVGSRVELLVAGINSRNVFPLGIHR